VLVELQDRDKVAVHPDVAEVVDTLVRGYPVSPEIRWRDEKDTIHIEKPSRPAGTRGMVQGTRRSQGIGDGKRSEQPQPYVTNRQRPEVSLEPEPYEAEPAPRPVRGNRVLRIYPYGVARNRLQQAAARLGVPAQIAREVEEADMVMTLRAYYRSRQQPIIEAEGRGVPIYVLRANTINQIEQSLAEVFSLPGDNMTANFEEVTRQTESAIKAVINGQRWVDLPPASATVRRIQHEMARQAELVSHSYGKDPNRRVRIFRE